MAVDPANGQQSVPVSGTVDAVPPATPTVNGSTGASLGGSAEPGSTVTLTDGNGNAIGETTANGNGQWTYTPATPLPDGTVVNVTATDAAGNSSPIASTTVDSVPPSTPVIDPSNGQLFTGTAEVGASVILRDAGGNVIGQVTADGSGHWSFAPQPALPNGTQISAQAVDAAGNSSGTAAVTVDAQPPAAPVVTPSSGNELGGTAEPNAQVVVISANGQVIAEVPVGANGTWSYTPSSPLPDGTTLSVVAVDSAGNRSGTTTVTVDSTPPADPVVNPSNGTNISGSAEPGSTVTVTDGNNNPVGQTTADGSGNWSITPSTPLPNGTSVTVVATDAAGNPSNGTSATVDSTPPTAPVAAPSNGAALSGTGEEGSTLVFTDAAGNSLGQVQVGAGGNWSFTPQQPLADGTVVTIVARDAAGNQAAPVQVTVDAVAPSTPTLDPSNGTVLGGSGEIGSTVIVSVAGSEVARVVVDPNGHWSYTPGSQLANGTAVTVQATDAAGNTTPLVSGSVDSVAPPTPQIDPSAGTTFTGTGEAGATVILSGPGGEIGRAVVNADGHWTFTTGTAVANGASVSAIAQDAAGNTSGSASVVVDSTPPNTPTINPSNGSELHGTAEIGSTITLVYANNVLIGQATTDGTGHWTFTPNQPLADGTRIDVVAQDAAGNASPVASIVIDAIPPAAPVVAPSNGSVVSGTAEAGSLVVVSLDGTELGRTTADGDGKWSIVPNPQPGNGDAISVVATDPSGNNSQPTNVTIDADPPAAPTLSITNGDVLSGMAEAGSTLILTDGNGNSIGQVTVDAGGHWSFTPGTPLANGTVVNAVAVDAAGNAGPPTSTTVDVTLPAAPTIDPSNGSVVTGTAEANALVRILDGNGATLVEVSADGAGNWSWTPPTQLANGVQISAVTVDGPRVSGETSITIDAVAPNAPVIDASNGTVLTGTAEAGSTVTLTDGTGNAIGQAVADSTGHWTVTPTSPLANGTVVNAVAEDAAGNASQVGSVTVDSVPPPAPVVNASNGAVVTGTAELGATVILTDGNGNPIGKVVADPGTGQWSFTPNPPLLGGTTVNAVAQDAAGNTSTLANTLVDTTAPTTPTILPSNGVVLSGTGEIGSSIVLTDGNGNPVGQVTVDGNGKWSYTPTAPLANGTQVNAVSVDAAGNQSSSVNTVVDNSAPANPTINLSNGALLTGSAEAGALVLLTDGNGNAIGQVRADSNGAWSLAVSPALANGTLVNAVAKDAAGNTSGSVSTTIDSVAPQPPTIAASNGTELHGTAENNATVLLTDSNGNVIGQTTASAGGAWSFTPTSPLANGTVVNAVARDATGNTSGAVNTTIDSVAPSAPTINPSNGAALAGTAEANATVILTDGNGNAIGQVTADGSGRWSYTPGSQLANGTVVNAVARDAAGNTSGAASTTVDSVAPPQPTINPTNGAHLLGTAEAGSTVILTDGNGNAIGQVTADGTGHWTFNPTTALANGTTVNVVSRDAAGNTSLLASTVVDSVAPPTPTIQPSNGTALAGTGEINATIVLRDGNGNLIGTTQVDGTGHWQFAPSPALANGTTVNAMAQDAAGNSSGPASTVVDSLAPNPPTVDPCNGTIISGTAEVNATVILKVGGLTIATLNADATGHWSFSPLPGLANNTQVSVTATDAAGNVSSVVNVVVDAVAPLVPTLMASDGTVFAGTAEANSTVILRVGGTLLAEVKVDANGNWQYVPTVAVADSVQVTAVARDAAGNQGPSVSVVVDSDLPAIPVITPSNGTVISGTAEANATIIITNSLGGAIGQVTAGIDGTWSFTPGTQLANGTVVNVVARDASGNLSAAAVMVVDSVAPTVPVVTPSNGSALAGTAEAGASVVLSVAGVPIATVTADASGHWSYTPGTALLNGVVVSVVAKDAAGNTSVAASVTVDRIPPNTPVVAASNGVTFNGTAEANSTVIISGANGALLGQVTAGANGAWTFTPTTPIANGVVVSVVAKDAAGNVSVVAATTTVDAIAPPLPVINPSNGTVLAGSAEAGATVILSVGGSVIGQVTANALGQWSFTPGTALANNTQVSVVARDAVGNTSVAASVTVDAVAPTAPVVAPSNGSVLSGTAEIGSTVILKVGGAIIAQVTADATGHWSYTPGTALANNTQVSVTAKDAAGNVSIATTIGVDSVAPVAPSGLSVTANGTVLTGIAEANSTVKVIINGDTANPITVQANGSGNFTVNLSPALTAGQLLTVNAVDAAGNVGTAIQIQAPDLTRPVLTIAEAADGYINKAELSDGIQVRVGLTAGARAGQTLTLRYTGPGGYTFSQAHVLTSAEILAGVALVTMLPAAGVGVIPQGAATVTADVNGGLTATPASFTLDTIAPANPVLSLVGNLLTISSEPSSTLLVDAKLLGLVSHTEVAANNAGLASLDLLSGLATTMSWDQLLDASVTVGSRDAAGNVGNLVGIDLENVLTQNTITIGSLGLAVGLLPPVLGLSGTAIAGGSLGVEIITPLLNVSLHPIVDSTGHFTINLLAPDLLAQLGLSVTQLLNLGSQLSINLIAYDAAGHASATYGLSLTGAGLSLALGEVSVTGTAGADVLMGTNATEHFYGNAGADLFLHVGQGDIVQAGDGNDTIQLQSTLFKSVDGGAGFDTVILDSGINLTYGALFTGTMTNIERISLGKGDAAPSSLTLTAAQVDAVTDANNVLQITGDTNDTLTVRGAVDTGANQLHGGVSYDVYTFGNTTLLVEENTVHVVVS
ncbi:Ig-like domain-containing protein [Pseudomonas sp. CAN2814]|uniref:Ig-like domain-containing protein n=1 Tax=Pseudomonas sp. CAN1 TaxID=3046726 RepID=UPI0026496B70|nr:Ig-like domain-containing protein [Pseudomonas sp. CAN1]MDN6860982.1 Ig-like domain-containing protein [Pseudomonas sp. CAN1]